MRGLAIGYGPAVDDEEMLVEVCVGSSSAGVSPQVARQLAQDLRRVARFVADRNQKERARAEARKKEKADAADG